MPVKGIDQVRKRYRQTVQDLSEKTAERGIYAILSQGAAIAQTLTPIDTGNLINSQTAPQIFVTNGRIVGRVGYTAFYAAYVHDAPGTLMGRQRPGNRGEYWGPSAEPKFLEKGFEQIVPRIPAILKRISRV